MSVTSENYSLFGGASGARTQAWSVVSYRVFRTHN